MKATQVYKWRAVRSHGRPRTTDVLTYTCTVNATTPVYHFHIQSMTPVAESKQLSAMPIVASD